MLGSMVMLQSLMMLGSLVMLGSGGNEPSKEQPEKDRIFINGKWYVEEVEDDE